MGQRVEFKAVEAQKHSFVNPYLCGHEVLLPQGRLHPYTRDLTHCIPRNESRFLMRCMNIAQCWSPISVGVPCTIVEVGYGLTT